VKEDSAKGDPAMTQIVTPAVVVSKKPLTLVYSLLIAFADKLQSPFLLLIRLYIGYQCVISGWAHLHNIPGMTNFFTKLHIPFPEVNVVVSGTAELVGGVLLLAGFASRFVAIVLTGNFIVALLTVELSNYDFSWKELGAQIWKDQSPILGDTAFPFLATAIIILLFGPGWLSVDGLIKLIRGKK
jgi:putative oxidoreductase